MKQSGLKFLGIPTFRELSIDRTSRSIAVRTADPILGQNYEKSRSIGLFWFTGSMNLEKVGLDAQDSIAPCVKISLTALGPDVARLELDRELLAKMRDDEISA